MKELRQAPAAPWRPASASVRGLRGDEREGARSGLPGGRPAFGLHSHPRDARLPSPHLLPPSLRDRARGRVRRGRSQRPLCAAARTPALLRLSRRQLRVPEQGARDRSEPGTARAPRQLPATIPAGQWQVGRDGGGARSLRSPGSNLAECALHLSAARRPRRGTLARRPGFSGSPACICTSVPAATSST